jgi:hypothetical protein
MKMEIKNGVNNPKDIAITDANFLSMTYAWLFSDELVSILLVSSSSFDELPKSI